MINRRPYLAEGAIAPGSGVVQGSADNKVKAPVTASDAEKFIGVFPFEANEAKADGDPVGIALAGTVKVLLGGTATAGSKAVLSTSAGNLGAFENVPATDGEYDTCGLFLQSGTVGQYVDMFIERGAVTVATA
jgi:hypothetical protein